MRFEALLSFHQHCIETTSKESKSKSKCIIEFTLHTWMKYLFCDSSWKMQACCSCLCVCAQAGMCVKSQFGGCMIGPRLYWMCQSMTPEHPAVPRIDNITLCRPLHSAALKPPGSRLTCWELSPSRLRCFYLVEISLLMPSEEFAWHWPYTERCNLLCRLHWSGLR